MLKPALLVKLLKQRLNHNKTWLKQDQITCLLALQLSYGNGVDTCFMEGYSSAATEEVEFLEVLLKELEKH